MKGRCRTLLLPLFLLLALEPSLAQVYPGIDVLAMSEFDAVANKRVGLVLNQTAVRRDIRFTTLDAFLNTRRCQVTALFAPEHGIDGAVLAGEHVGAESRSGIPVHSLYGATRTPTAEMMKDVDVMVYDIQDIGVRSYTYISTLLKVMEGCAAAGKPLVVLDRPNPIGGDVVDGNVLQIPYRSFVGPAPIPYVHGLTVGELATMANEEGWLEGGARCDLRVIRMSGWRREMAWEETGLTWIPTSPHVPDPQTTFAIAATGAIGELGIINVGVGYTMPFELIGAPWVDPEELASRLNGLGIRGLYFRPTRYQPFYAMYSGKMCGGVQLIRTGEQVAPFTTTVAILTTVRDLYPDGNLLEGVADSKWDMFTKVAGTPRLGELLRQGAGLEEIVGWWQPDLYEYIGLRERYLLYE